MEETAEQFHSNDNAYTYTRLDGITAELLEQQLQGWVRSQRGEHLAKWHQLSAVFCAIGEEPSTASIIFHKDDNGKRIACLAPSWRPKEHLLFVQYNADLHWLRIYGSLSLARYHEFVAECGYLTLGNLQASLYTEVDGELLCQMMAMRPYYTLDATQQEYSLEEFVDATDLICTQVLELQLRDTFDEGEKRRVPTAEYSEEKRLDADLVALLRNDTDNSLGLLGALFLASCHRRFGEALIRRELRLLSYRLELCYTTEQQRAWFVDTWFPGLLRRQVNHFDRLVGHPDALYLCQTLHTYTGLDVLQKQHARVQQYWEARYPGEPQPAHYWHGLLQHLPEALEWGLPCMRGQVILTYRELPTYLHNYLEWWLQERIGETQLHCSTALTMPVWSRIERAGKRFRVSNIRSLISTNERSDGPLMLAALLERQELQFAFREFDADFLEGYALPFLRQLEGEFGLEWRDEPALVRKKQPSSAVHPDAVVPADHSLPQSYAELLGYAQQHWPPCMLRLVRQCHGQQHLTYDPRLKMAAMIRQCGYSEEQGEQLWCQLFSETDVYRRAAGDFLETEQGQVIRYDYKHSKQERLGTSCKNLGAGGYCPVREELGTVDIEECQMGCLAGFNRQHNATLQFRIRSPPNYFQLSMKRA